MTDDNWEYKRTRQQHFTTDELTFIRKCFEEKWTAKNVARKLECSSRVIQTHFANLKAEIPVRERGPMKPRFYRSSFDLEDKS